MKKLLIILTMIIPIMTVLSNELENKEKLNEYISSLQLKKITHNGVEGYFLPHQGRNQMIIYFNDYIYCQKIIMEKDKTILRLEKYEKINFKLKTGLGISISFNAGLFLLGTGIAILTYNLRN